MVTPAKRLSLLRHEKHAMLTHTVAKRAGIVAKKWWGQTRDVSISRREETHALTFCFTFPAGGRGTTQFEVGVKSEDFPAVLAIMSATDREATLKAMADELRFQICGYK
jgi:hypothetical protein